MVIICFRLYERYVILCFNTKLERKNPCKRIMEIFRVTFFEVEKQMEDLTFILK